MNKTNIVWFRNDLRVHDNEALSRAAETGEKIVPVYILDPRQLGTTRLGFPRMERFRAEFLVEGLADLRERMRKLGGDLLIRRGKSEAVLRELAQEVNAGAVYFHSEYATEEVHVEEVVVEMLGREGLEACPFQGTSLYHPEDLLQPPQKTPDVFSQFRKKVEKYSQVRELFASPTEIRLPEGLDPGAMPVPEELQGSFAEASNTAGFSPATIEEPAQAETVPNNAPSSPKGVLNFQGGETAALARLEAYCGFAGPLKTYKETRNGMLGADYSSKFSPWLAQGSLSPRMVYWKIKAYEEAVVANQSTYWLIFELLWRDFFRYWAAKHQHRIFQFAGISTPNYQSHPDEAARFERWKTGTTGIPFVDANMRELNATGFMSNRGRQNVASFLIHDLQVNWLWGAEYFESLLVDYDVYSNYGNWTYLAGVGADPRPNRYFNILRQAERYDENGDYVRHWIPELSYVPADKIQTTFWLSEEELDAYSASEYPRPMFIPKAWNSYSKQS